MAKHVTQCGIQPRILEPQPAQVTKQASSRAFKIASTNTNSASQSGNAAFPHPHRPRGRLPPMSGLKCITHTPHSHARKPFNSARPDSAHTLGTLLFSSYGHLPAGHSNPLFNEHHPRSALPKQPPVKTTHAPRSRQSIASWHSGPNDAQHHSRVSHPSRALGRAAILANQPKAFISMPRDEAAVAGQSLGPAVHAMSKLRVLIAVQGVSADDQATLTILTLGRKTHGFPLARHRHLGQDWGTTSIPSFAYC